ncbi:MAG: methyltransferase family protein [Gemmatimonadales bacterium]
MPESSSQAPANAQVRFPPPLVYALPLAATFFLDAHWPLPLFGGQRHAPQNIAGVILVLVGALVMASALIRFRRAGTSPVPVRPATALLLTGPYRWTRNPMYLGLMIAYLGGGVLLRSWWAVIFLPFVWWVMNAYVIAREERYLDATFGDAYRTYRAEVRRWI